MNVQQLRADLAGFKPEDERESRYRRQILDLIDHVDAPCSRYTFDPGHVTASGFVVSPDRRSLLLVKHRKLGWWLQPGGHIESVDDDVVAAQRREIEEETGLRSLEWLGVFDLDVHRFPERGDEPAHLHFDVRSAFVAGTFDVAAGDGADDIRWFPFDELPREDPSITRPLQKLRRLVDKR